MVVWSSVNLIFFVRSSGKSLGTLLNVVTWLTLLVLDMVLYLCVLRLYTLMPVFVTFSTYGISWSCTSGVPSLSMLILIFDISLFLGATAEFYLVAFIFSGFTCWSSSGYDILIGTLVGFAWVIVCFTWYYFKFSFVHLLEFLWACLLDWHPWRICWGSCFYKYLCYGFQWLLCSFPSVTNGLSGAAFWI